MDSYVCLGSIAGRKIQVNKKKSEGGDIQLDQIIKGKGKEEIKKKKKEATKIPAKRREKRERQR